MAVKRRSSIAAAAVGASETKKQCTSVAKALLAAEALPDSCKNLLNGMAVNALSTYAAERHPFQTQVMGMINTTLSEIETAMIKRNADTESKVGNAEGEKTTRDVAKDKAQTELQSKKEIAAAKKDACDEAEASLTTAKAALADATKKQKAADAALAKSNDKRAKVECFKAGVFIPLKDGSVEKKEQPKSFKQVSAFYSEFPVEKAMVSAANDALHQPPAERSTFLATAIAQMEEKLNAISTELAKQIDLEEAAQKESSQEVEAAKVAVESATSAASEAAAALKEATTQQQAAQATLRAADAACKHYFSDMKKMMDGFDQSKKDLEEFQTKVMCAFKELETLAAPPPQAPEPEETAGAEPAEA